MATNGNGVFKLDDHRDPVAAVIEVRGEKHQVLKFKRRQYAQMTNLETLPAAHLYQVVREVVPTLPDDVLEEFDKETCWTVLAIAGNGIGIVEKLFPNGRSPEPNSTTSPG